MHPLMGILGIIPDFNRVCPTLPRPKCMNDTSLISFHDSSKPRLHSTATYLSTYSHSMGAFETGRPRFRWHPNNPAAQTRNPILLYSNQVKKNQKIVFPTNPAPNIPAHPRATPHIPPPRLHLYRVRARKSYAHTHGNCTPKAHRLLPPIEYLRYPTPYRNYPKPA